MRKTSRRISKLLLVLLALLIVFSALPTSSARGATQTLGGRTVTDDLRITVMDDGRMNVQRYTGTAWESQIYGGSSKGSRLQFSGGSMGLGYFSGSFATLVSNTVATASSGGLTTYTGTTRWTGSGFEVILTTTYRDGDPYFKLNWKITNNSGSAKSDLRFYHGEDTYLRNGDNGAGWVDWANYTIGVKKNVTGGEQRMSLQSVSPDPYAYQSDNYYSVRQAVNNGGLSRNIDANESTDNGYALEWRSGSLANGAAWNITAYEKFNNATIGAVQVLAPVAVDCNKGTTCSALYTVKNPGSSAVNATLTYTTSTNPGGWTVTAPWSGASETVSVPARGQITRSFSISVPSNAANGSSLEVTLNAAPPSGSASAETAAINAIAPPNSPPSAVLLNGSTNAVSVSENNGANQLIGTLSATDPDGETPALSLVSGGDASAFTIASGTQLRNVASFNYETKTSYGITVRATDGQGATRDQAFTINVTNVNETPSLADPGAKTTTEDTALTFTMTATDPDGQAGRLNWSVLAGSGPLKGAVTGATATGGSKSITYTPTANANGSDSFVVRVTGEGGTTADRTINVTISAVNDSPANQWNLGNFAPDTQKVRVGQAFSFDASGASHIGNRLSIGDVDADTLQVNLGVLHGALSLSATTGLTGDLTGADGTLQATGSLATLNDALKGLTYTPAAGYSGADTLTMTVLDLGNTGSGGPKSDTDTVPFDISNPNALVIDAGFTGGTAGWGYTHFRTIEEALAAARGIDASNTEPKPALTAAIQPGSYLSDSIVLDVPTLTLSLDGDVTLGKDLAVTQGVLNANNHKLTFATGTGDITNHVVSGTVNLHDLEAAAGNTIELASGADMSLTGALAVPSAASFDAIPASGRSTLQLASDGAQTLPTGLTVDHLIIGASTIFTAPAELNIQGDLTNTNEFNGGSGTVTFNGPSGREQAIAGTMPSFNNLAISAGSSVRPTTDLEVAGDWNDAGDFDANGHEVTFTGADSRVTGTVVFHDLTIADGATLDAAEGADLGFSGAFAYQGTGVFNPTSSSILRMAGTGEQTLPATLNNLRSLAINAGASLDAAGRNLTLTGDLINDGAFDNSGGSVSFTGTDAGHTILVSDTATTQFGGLNNAAGNTLTLPGTRAIEVNGDWANAGTFASPDGAAVIFNNTGAQSFSGATAFSNVEIASGSILNLQNNADFGYGGSLTLGGTLNATNPGAATTVRLAGPGEQTLPAGLNNLYDLVIDAGASLNAANRVITLNHGLTNNGSFDNTGGELVFDGEASHPLTLGATATQTQFGSLDITGGDTLTSNCSTTQPLVIAGDWDKTGTFAPSGNCKVIFNGTGIQNINGAGNSFYQLEIRNTATFPNDETDVNTQNAVTVTNALMVVSGQFQPANGSSFASVVLGGAEETENGVLRPNNGEDLTVTGSFERMANGWFDANGGTVRFTGTGAGWLRGGATFYDLQIARDTAASLQSSAPVIVENNLVVEEGSFKPSSSSRFNTVEIQSGGELLPVGNINISGDLDNAGSYTHNNKAVTFDGSGAQKLSGRVDFYNLTVNVGSALTLDTNATLGYAGAFNLKGTLDTTTYPHNTVEVMGSGFQQTLSGAAPVTVDNLKINATSSLKLMGNLTVTGDLEVVSGGLVDVNTYAVAFQNGGTQPSFNGSMTFADVTIADGATLGLKENASFRFTGAVTGAGTGKLDGVTDTTGTTVTVAGAAGQIPDGSLVNHLVIENGNTLLGGGRTLTVAGNWNTNDTGAFTPETSTVIFNGGVDQDQTISGANQAFSLLRVDKAGDSILTAGVVTTSNTLDMDLGIFAPACGSTFNSVDISGGELRLPDDDACQVMVNEDWTQTGGMFEHNGAEVFFGGPDTNHTITGAVEFGALSVAGSHTINLGNGTNLTNLTLNDALTFGTGSGLVGSTNSTLTIAGDVTLPNDMTIENLVIEDGASLTAQVALIINGSLTNNGSFNNSTGSVTFGPGSHDVFTTGAGDVTQFGDLTIPDDVTLVLGPNGTAHDEIRVAGAWLNEGTFTPNQGTVVFNGTSAQEIRTDGASNGFYNLTIDNPSTVSSKNADGLAEVVLNIENNLIILQGELVVPTGSIFENVNINEGATIDLPAGADSVTVNGGWTNRGQITTGGVASLDGSFYVSTAEVSKDFDGGTAGLGFDKFNTLAAALTAARDYVYILNSVTPETVDTFAEDLAIDPTADGSPTTIEVIVQGKVQVNNVSLAGAGVLSLGSGGELTAGDFTQTNGAFNGNTGKLLLSGNFAQSGGAFNPGTGTVELNGTAAQSISTGAQFYDLTINNTADPLTVFSTTAGPITVGHHLEVANGRIQPEADSHFLTINIGQNGVFSLEDNTVTVYADPGGALTRHEDGKLYLNGGVIDGLDQNVLDVDADWPSTESGFGFDRFDNIDAALAEAGDGDIIRVYGAAAKYQALDLNQPVTLRIMENITFSGNLTLTQGMLEMTNGTTLTLEGNLSKTAGAFIANNSTVTLAGADGQAINAAGWVFDALQVNFTNPSFGATTQNTIHAIDLIVTEGKFTPLCGSTFDNVTLEAGGELILPDTDGCTLTVSGTWNQMGGTYTHNNGKTIFNGNPAAISGASLSFYDLEVATGTTLTAPAGDLNITGGFTNDGTFNPNGGTVSFVGNTPQPIGGTGDLTFNSLVFGATSRPQPAKEIELSGDLTVNAGAAFTPPPSLNFTGTGLQTVNATSGTLTVTDLSINNTGDMVVMNPAMVVTNGLAINQGELELHHDSSVQNGSTTATAFLGAQGRLTLINEGPGNGTVLTVDNWSSEADGVITPNSGELLTNRVAEVWVDNNFIPGSTPGFGIDRFDSINTALGISYLADGATLNIAAGTYVEDVLVEKNVEIVVDGDLTLDNLTLEHAGAVFTAPASKLTLKGNLTLTAGTFDPNGGTLALDGTAAIPAGVTLHNLEIASGAAFTAPGAFTLTGNFENKASAISAAATTLTFDGGGSHTFTGAAGFQSISVTAGDTLAVAGNAELLLSGALALADGPNALSMAPTATLTLNAAGEQTLPSGLTLTNLKISTGASFNAPELLTLTGSLTNDGVFSMGTGTVQLTGSAAQAIGSTNGATITFNNLTIDDADDDAGANQVGASMVAHVSGLLKITDGEYRPTVCSNYASVEIGADGVFTPAVSGCTFGVTGNWINDGTFTAGSSSFAFNGTGAQTIGGAQNTTFNDLNIHNSSETESVTVTAPRTVSATNGLLVTDGVFEPTSGSSFADVTIDGGTLKAPTGALIVTGDWVTSTNLGSAFDANNGTVRFSGAGQHNLTGPTQFNNLEAADLAEIHLMPSAAVTVTGALNLTDGSISGAASSNLSLQGTGPATLPDNTTLGGLTVGPQVAFTAPANLTLIDGLVNNGQFTAGEDLSLGGLTNNGGFDAGTGTVTFTGTAPVIAGDVTLHDVAFDDSDATMAPGTTLRLTGDMTIGAEGSLDGSADGTTLVYTGSGARTLPDNVSLNNLVVGEGVTLSAPDNLTLTGGLQVDGTFDNTGGSVTFNGPEISNHRITGAGLLTFGDVNIAAGSRVAPDDGRDFNVTGNWDNAGEFVPADGLVTFNGAAAQAITGTTIFGDVSFDNEQGVTASGGFTSTGDLTVIDGTLTLPDGAKAENISIQPTGGLALQEDVIAPIEPATLTVYGDWSNDGSFTGNEGTVSFEGAGAQNISGTTVFDNLNIGDTSQLTPATGANLGYTGGFTIATGGQLDTGSHQPNTLTVAGDGDPVQELPDGLTLNNLVVNSDAVLNGADTGVTLTGGLAANGNVNGGLDVIFDGEGAQAVTGDGALHLGDVTINEGSTVEPAAGRDIFVSGGWSNDGGFTPGTNTVTFDGPEGVTHHIGGANVTTFYDLDLSGGTASGPVDVNGTTTVAAGAAFEPATGSAFNHVLINGTFQPALDASISISGDLTDNAVNPNLGLQHDSGTIIFDSSGPQAISSNIPDRTIAFNNLIISNPGTVITIPLAVDGDFRLADGGGTVTIPDGSSFNNVIIGTGSAFNLASDAEITVGGAWNNQGSFNANGGGLTGDMPDIETAIADLDFCTATPGSCGVERFATIQAAIDAVVDGGVVRVLPSSSPAASYGTSGTDTLVIGATREVRVIFEGDIDDTFSILGNINQSSGSIIAPPGTLSLNGDYNRVAGGFNPNNGLVILDGSGAQAISGAAVTFNNLTIDDADDTTGANSVLASAAVNVTGALNVTDGAFRPAMCGAYGSVSIGAQGLFAPQNAEACVNVQGGWTNDGSYTTAGEVVSFDGTTAQVIGGANRTTFGGLTINNTSVMGVSVADGTPVTVAGMLTLTDGIFSPTTGSIFNTIDIAANGVLEPDADAELHVSGDINNTGLFTHNDSSVILQGNGNQVLTGNFTFYDLTVNRTPADSTVDVTGNLAVTNNLTVTSGELLFGSGADFHNITTASDGALTPDLGASFSISGNWVDDGTFTHNDSTVTFDGTGPQAVSGMEDLYNVTVDNTANPADGDNDVEFDAPVTFLNNLVVEDGQMTPMTGSTFENVSIQNNGRFVVADDLDAGTENIITVSGLLNNRGLFDLNGSTTNGTITVDRLYVSDQYGLGTPGLGVDHFENIADALSAVSPDLIDGTTIVIYGGTYNGDVSIDDRIHLELLAHLASDANTAAPIVLDGSLTINHAEASVSIDNGELKINGSLSLTAGSFDTGESQVTFNGATAQVLNGALTFYDLNIANTADPADDTHDVKTSAAITVTNHLYVTDGQFSPQPCSTFGSVTIATGGILKPQAASIGCDSGLAVTGNWDNTGGTFTNNGAAVTFEGNGPQTISDETGFGDLTIDNDQGVTASGNFASNGDLTVADGELTLPDDAQVANLIIEPDGRLALVEDTTEPIEPATLIVTGNWDDQTSNGGFTAHDGTVNFNGGGEQLYSGVSTLHNINVGPGSSLVLDDNADLGFSGGITIDPLGTFDPTTHPGTTVTVAGDGTPAQTLPGSLTLNNLVIDDGAVLSGGTQDLTLLGDFDNNGTFDGGTGSVTFAGPEGVTQNISGTGDTNFNNLNVQNDVAGDAPADVTGTLTVADGGTYQPGTGSTIDNVVIADGGTLDGSDGSLTITGNWLDQNTTPGGFEPGEGSVLFDGGPDAQTITGPSTFNDLHIGWDDPLDTEDAPVSVTVIDPLVVLGTATIDDGEFVQVQSGSTFGGIVIEDGGTLVAEDNATDILVDNYVINPGGSFNASGGVFRPSNIFWDNDAQSKTLPEKPAGLNLGELYTVDLNGEDQTSFAYALVTDDSCAQNDNSFFSLSVQDERASVITAEPLDFETRASYTLCVKTTDASALSVIRTLTIIPTDANDEPVVTEDASDGTVNGQLTIHAVEDDATDVTLNATDQDLDGGGNQRDTLTWALVSGQGPAHGNLTLPQSMTGNSVTMQYTTTEPNWNGNDHFSMTVTDGTAVTTLNITVVVDPVNDAPINVLAPEIITGSPAQTGQVTRASSGDWNDSIDAEAPGAINITYQWQRADDDQGTNATDIVGANNSSYLPSVVDQGKFIRAMVTATDNGNGLPTSTSTTEPTVWVFVQGQQPSGIFLSATTVAEKKPVGTLVGTMIAVDEDLADTASFALVAGVGDTNNSAFTINGDQLLTNQEFLYAAKSSYSIRIRATDSGGNTVETPLIINIVGARADLRPKSNAVLEYIGPEEAGNIATITIPVGSVLDELTLLYTPIDDAPSVPSGLGFADFGFDLTAMINGSVAENYEFNKPLTLTLNYSDAGVAEMRESSLKLMSWNGTAWEEAACGDVQADETTNTMIVPVCTASQFALFATPQNETRIFLPLIAVK